MFVLSHLRFFGTNLHLLYDKFLKLFQLNKHLMIIILFDVTIISKTFICEGTKEISVNLVFVAHVFLANISSSV